METVTGLDATAIVHDEDHSLWLIQVWMKQLLTAKKSLKTLRYHQEKVKTALRLLLNAKDASNIDEAQRLLFPEPSMKLIVQILSVLPKDPLIKDRNSDVMIGRKLLTGLLISSFSDDMLGNASPGAARSSALQAKSIAVRHSATILCRQWIKLLKALTESTPLQLNKFRRLLWQFHYSTRHYLDKFKEWKALDAELLQQSMEETFSQSYLNLLMAKVACHQGDADTSIVAAAEEQSNRLREVLRQLLGPQKAHSRIEEIIASIESSFPEYLRIYGESAASGATSPTKRVLTTTADATSSSLSETSAATLPTSSLVDTTELRRTLTPVPGDTSSSTSAAAPTVAKESQGATASPTVASAPTEKAMSDAESTRYLQLLSKLAGIENERLAHEITLDKFFRLPSKPSAVSRVLPGKKPSLVHSLRLKMLQVLADKLVNALRPSNIASIDNLSVGMVIPVKLFPRTHASGASSAENRDNYYTLSAEILNISHSVQTLEGENTANDDKDVANFTENPSALRLQVRYISDDSVEDDIIALDRVKLRDEKPDPRPLLNGLFDIMQSIAGLVPNRPDIHQQLQGVFDPFLLQQVIVQGTLQPVRDILPICRALQGVLVALHAEYRVESALLWSKTFENTFEWAISGGSTATPADEKVLALWQEALTRYFPLKPAAETTSGQTHEKDNEEKHDSYAWIALMPLFFEHITESVEEIQRDLANFYISQLVPVLQTHGRAFLAQRFRDRLLSGLMSLDRTAHWLQWSLTPDSLLSLFVTQLPPPFQSFWSSMRPLLGLTACNQALQEAEFSMFAEQGKTSIALADLASLSTLPSTSSVNNPLVMGILAYSMCTLLQFPVRLDQQAENPQQNIVSYVLPEVFVWDTTRLAAIRDDIDMIALECGITMSVRQMLQQRYRIAHVETEEIELQHRLDILLRSSASSQDEETGATTSTSTTSAISMDNLVTEVVRYVEYAIQRSRQNTSPSSLVSTVAAPSAASPSTTAASTNLTYDIREITAIVEKLLREVVIHDASPVFQLFTKRIYRILLRACLGQPYAHKLTAFSLQSQAQTRNLHTLIEKTMTLFQHTMAVHGDIYREVLSAMAQKLLIQEEQARILANDQVTNDRKETNTHAG